MRSSSVRPFGSATLVSQFIDPLDALNEINLPESNPEITIVSVTMESLTPLTLKIGASPSCFQIKSPVLTSSAAIWLSMELIITTLPLEFGLASTSELTVVDQINDPLSSLRANTSPSKLPTYTVPKAYPTPPDKFVSKSLSQFFFPVSGSRLITFPS